MYSAGNNAGFGWTTDGTYTGGSNVELTTMWGIHSEALHIWSPKWRTSAYAGYVEVDYDGAAATFMCGAGVGGFVAAPGGFTGITNVSNCNPNFSFWQAGSRTQWNPHPDLDVGLEVIWTHLNTAFKGTATLAANGARPGGAYVIDDQDIVSVLFRIQRNFLP
jgi:hypothetical protein